MSLLGALRRMTNAGVQRVAATCTSCHAHTPSATAIDGGPCDFIWVTTEDATVTGTLADGEAFTTPALRSRMFNAFSFATITAVSAGSVYVGWYAK